MYSILKLTKRFSGKYEYVYVQKLTGSLMSGYISARNLSKYKLKFADFCFIVIRDDMPPHFCVATYPVKKFIQFDDDWRLLKFMSLSNPFSKYLLSAVYDKDKIPNMNAVLDFLHDSGERVLRSPKSENKLPL